jgi:lipopolysaccharide/colanic/teichoic acid biosynthesis glycosyltransferase/glycosyltransferase involved in cell wall biosynthesis
MISVIVPAHNAAATIGACVSALQQQCPPRVPFELIVVDAASSDQTARLAQQAGARVVCCPSTLMATARNEGIQAATGHIICFTDAYCVPAHDWLQQITLPFSNPDVAGCKGVYRSQQKETIARFVQREYEEKYSRLSGEEQIDFIDTYSAAYRKEILLANGGFDARFPILEDQELSFRLAARGYRLVFQPAAAVYHNHSDAIGTYFRKKFTIGYWKAQVVRRFPGRGLRDSHTPQVLKLQMLLISLAFLAALPAPLVVEAGLAAAGLTALFVLTTIPFCRSAWERDRSLVWWAPFLLAVRAAALSLGYAWGSIQMHSGISGQEATIGGLNYVCKRMLDITGALVGLVVALVLGPWIALAIKLDSPGPIFFRQERIGQAGRPFTMVKFRSMDAGAEEKLASLVDIDQLPEPAFKLADDPRVTAVGRFLRRWSLDELPQFWNVLKGEMSLVGPRPEESRLVTAYNDWHRRRLAVKPGMSGPMQVNGRADLSLDARVRLEVAYIENYSLWTDLSLLWHTIPNVLGGKGAR